jgi:hypothetical protein
LLDRAFGAAAQGAKEIVKRAVLFHEVRIARAESETSRALHLRLSQEPRDRERERERARATMRSSIQMKAEGTFDRQSVQKDHAAWTEHDSSPFASSLLL